MPLQGVKIFIDTHTRSGSTMINTRWYVQIDAHELFYLMILPVERTLIDLAVSMKSSLELYKDAHGTSILATKMNALQRTMREPIVWWRGTIGYMKLQMLLLHREVIMKNKNKWELSVTAWMNELLWKARLRVTIWHHDVDITILSLVLKATSEEHRMLYGDVEFCLSTPAFYKVSTKANI